MSMTRTMLLCHMRRHTRKRRAPSEPRLSLAMVRMPCILYDRPRGVSSENAWDATSLIYMLHFSSLSICHDNCKMQRQAESVVAEVTTHQRVSRRAGTMAAVFSQTAARFLTKAHPSMLSRGEQLTSSDKFRQLRSHGMRLHRSRKLHCARSAIFCLALVLSCEHTAADRPIAGHTVTTSAGLTLTSELTSSVSVTTARARSGNALARRGNNDDEAGPSNTAAIDERHLHFCGEYEWHGRLLPDSKRQPDFH